MVDTAVVIVSSISFSLCIVYCICAYINNQNEKRRIQEEYIKKNTYCEI
jgi:hypothetical protein